VALSSEKMAAAFSRMANNNNNTLDQLDPSLVST